ncbi:MAG: TrmH family RNA methyltransferase [Flavobacteriaceae bacterium]
MVVKSQIKFIKSLQQKKYRTRHRLFVAEGIKTVRELLMSDYKEYAIYSTDPDFFETSSAKLHLVSRSELVQMSGLKSPNTCLGVFHIPEPETIDFNDWVVALDGVNDPGNLGTIIRLCDWFGIKHLLCSQDTVDCYNPKVLQATMGSISRVNIHYVDLKTTLTDTENLVYGAFMEGKEVYSTKLAQTGILVMGNEANGISEELSSIIAQKISIPQFGEQTTESLNVATATAILLNEIRRKA